MTEKGRLTAALARAVALRDAGDLQAAEAVLEAVRGDPFVGDLGQMTALGLPRRLQSVMLKLAKSQGDRVRRAGLQFHLVPPPGVLAGFAAFTLEERRAIAGANRLAVPRVLHQIWIGALAVPPGVAAWRAHAQAQGYGHRLWREDDLLAIGLGDDPVFAGMLARGDYPGAVDVARYRVLAAEGGVYLDCDWYPAREDVGFHDLMPMMGLGAMAEDVPRDTGMGGLLLANSLIMAPVGHPVLARLNAVLPQVLALMPEAPAWWSTGPLIFTLIARGGAVVLADAGLVVASMPRGAAFADVDAARARAGATGLLIAWKSW
jgi:inositol phosphorylceramide mannosyltransferase catalytic subunit